MIRHLRRSLFAVAILWSTTASAQDDFLRKEAQQRFQEGTVLMNDGKYEEARAKFLQAYGTVRVPNVVFNLARCEHLTGRNLEASRHYREYLRVVEPSKITPKRREEVDGWLKDVGKTIGHLEITAPAGAHVTVDADRVGDAPLSEAYDVARGKHAVAAEINGKRLTAETDAGAGTITKVVLAEEPSPSSTVPITSGTQGSTPRDDIVTPPPREPERSSWSTTKTLGIAAWVGAAAAGVAGGLMLKSAGDKADDGRTATTGLPTCIGVTSPPCAQAKDDATSSAHLKTGGAIAIGGAVALAGAGLVLFLWPQRQHGAARPAPALVVQGAGLGVVQRF